MQCSECRVRPIIACLKLRKRPRLDAARKVKPLLPLPLLLMVPLAEQLLAAVLQQGQSVIARIIMKRCVDGFRCDIVGTRRSCRSVLDVDHDFLAKTLATTLLHQCRPHINPIRRQWARLVRQSVRRHTTEESDSGVPAPANKYVVNGSKYGGKWKDLDGINIPRTNPRTGRGTKYKSRYISAA